MADNYINKTGLQRFFSNIKNLFVSKSGDTMTGNLLINGSYDVDSVSVNTYNPSTRYRDKNGVGIAQTAGFVKTSGIRGVRIVAEREISGSAKYNVLDLGIDVSGNPTVQLASTVSGSEAAWRNAIGAVPTSRTVNSKALSSDISLTASDVGAVPTSRTVNGHALTGNVSVTLADLKLAMTAALKQVGFYLNSSNYPYIRWTDDSSNNYQLICGPSKFSYQTQASGGSWVNVWSLEANSADASNASTVSVATATDTTLCNTGALSAGTYLLIGTATFASNATGRRALFFASSTSGGVVNRYARTTVPPTNGGTTQVQVMMLANLTSATTYYLRAYQNSGSALNVTDAGIQFIRLNS